MNPETLRLGIREFKTGKVARDVCAFVDAAADAWKADLEEDTNIIVATSTQAVELMGEVDTLRKRLEAAEKELANAKCELVWRRPGVPDDWAALKESP